MKSKISIILKLIFGLFLFALGFVLAINANIGVAPWDVLHQGISELTGITVGRAHIYVGLGILIFNIILGESIGIGTILNMLLIGIFMDILIFYNLVPSFQGFILKLIMLILGMIIQGYGFYFYISATLGIGPRDGLMVVLTRRTGKSISLIKGSIETSVVLIGFILGGNFGIGTIIMALFTGYIWQIIFKSLSFDVDKIKHKTIF